MRQQTMCKHKMPEHIVPLHGKIRGVADLVVPDENVLIAEWRDVSQRCAEIMCNLDHTLQERHHLGMSEFEVLDRVVEAPGCALRMVELADHIHLTQSALSRTVARLERDGLVERLTCADDRRAVSVVATAAGRQRHAEAKPTHRGIIAESFPARVAA